MSALSALTTLAGGAQPPGQTQPTDPGAIAIAEFQPVGPASTSVTNWQWNGASSVTSGTPLWLTITYTGGKTFTGYLRPTNTGGTLTANDTNNAKEVQTGGADSRWWGMRPVTRTKRSRAIGRSTDFVVQSAADLANRADIVAVLEGVVDVYKLTELEGTPVAVPAGSYVTITGPEQNPTISAPVPFDLSRDKIMVGDIDLKKLVTEVVRDSENP